jgi:hypothetical protein
VDDCDDRLSDQLADEAHSDRLQVAARSAPDGVETRLMRHTVMWCRSLKLKKGFADIERTQSQKC